MISDYFTSGWQAVTLAKGVPVSIMAICPLVAPLFMLMFLTVVPLRSFLRTFRQPYKPTSRCGSSSSSVTSR